MTEKLAMSTLVALCSIAVGRPVQSSMVACFDENVPDSVVKTIAKRQPLRTVFGFLPKTIDAEE